MSNKLILIALVSLLGLSCKVKTSKEKSNQQNIAKPADKVTMVEEIKDIENKTLGRVSHQYRAAGCNTVIEVKLAEGEIQTLIPKDKLAAEFDVDGKELYFNFLLLRMPQPAGCTVGQPAAITDIVKK